MPDLGMERPQVRRQRGRFGGGLISAAGRCITLRVACMECAGRLTKVALSTLAAASSINIEDGAGMPSKKSVRAGNYTVGYAKPPAEHWFKPGQSGNPRGRPPKPLPPPPKEGGLTSTEASILRVMRGTVKVKSGEKSRWIASTDALAEHLLAQALGGDMRATRLLLELNREAEAREAQIAAQMNSEASVELTLMLSKLIHQGHTCKECGCVGYPLSSNADRDAPPGLEQPKPEPASEELPPSEEDTAFDFMPDCYSVEGSLNDAAPELITPIPEVHSPTLPMSKPKAPASPVKPAAQAFQPRRRGDPLISNTAPIVGVGWGVSGYGPPTPLR